MSTVRKSLFLISPAFLDCVRCCCVERIPSAKFGNWNPGFHKNLKSNPPRRGEIYALKTAVIAGATPATTRSRWFAEFVVKLVGVIIIGG